MATVRLARAPAQPCRRRPRRAAPPGMINTKADAAYHDGNAFHQGMLEASQWLIADQGCGEAIRLLREQGYRVVLSGHSLGGGCAIILGWLLRTDFPDLQVVACSPPPVVDENCADSDWAKEHVLVLILRDDIIPRVNVYNATVLMTELNARQQEWSRQVSLDLRAFRSRIWTLWAPVRATRTRPSGAAADSCAPQANRDAKLWTAPKAPPGDGSRIGGGRSGSSTPPPDHRESDRVAVDAEPADADAPAEPVADEAGPEDDSGVVADGTTGTPGATLRFKLPAWAQWRREVAADGHAGGGGRKVARGMDEVMESVRVRLKGLLKRADRGPPRSSLGWGTEQSRELDGVADALVKRVVGAAVEAAVEPAADGHGRLDEILASFEFITPSDAETVRLVVPGRIGHIYHCHGQSRCALVDHTFAGLRRVELSAHMVEDHAVDNVFAALRAVRAARSAPQQPPAWSSMGDPSAERCACCFSDITWSSTSSSEAEQARVMHHCRACGSVVCSACSEHRVSLLQLGMLDPQRVCDACYYRL